MMFLWVWGFTRYCYCYSTLIPFLDSNSPHFISFEFWKIRIRVFFLSVKKEEEEKSGFGEMVEQSVLVLEKQGPNPVLSEGIHDWVFECHGFLHNAGLIIASFLFLLYLALQAKKSFLKLSHGRSYIIISYYASLWLVSILNLLWCFSQVNLFFLTISSI